MNTFKSIKSSNYLDISIFVTKSSLSDFDKDNDSLSIFSLGSKLNDYGLRFGLNHCFLPQIAVDLLTKGKVRVDFNESTERLELTNNSLRFSRNEAIRIYDEWLRTNNHVDLGNSQTQKIVVQWPNNSRGNQLNNDALKNSHSRNKTMLI